jgi:hypothetical protein
MPKWIKELHDAEWLREAYQTRTVKQIGQLLSCAPSGVSQALKRHGIAARYAGRPPAPEILSDKDWLREQYKTRTSREIADEIGCHQCTVVEYLRAAEITLIPTKRRRKHPYKQRIDDDGQNIQDHRYVMEKHLGRKLTPDEHVHHLDEVKDNNALTNLIVLSKSDHHKLHAFYGYKRTCKTCGGEFTGANSAKVCRGCREYAREHS